MAREVIGMTGERPVLLWSEHPGRPDSFSLWGQWDAEVNIWWIYTDRECRNWITDAEDLSDIEIFGPEIAQDYRDRDPSVMPIGKPANDA